MSLEKYKMPSLLDKHIKQSEAIEEKVEKKESSKKIKVGKIKKKK